MASVHAFKFYIMEFSLAQRESQNKHCNNHRIERELILSVFLHRGKMIIIIAAD